jgi:adenosylcobinamide kinase/adenosylcobinamide-phosphate guanylyltransferase
MSQIILVTGPGRSGKSEWAEALALDSKQPVIYVATGTIDPTDEEWVARIAQHQQRRENWHWETLEVPIDLVGTIDQAPEHFCLLIDSLGTWVANLLEIDDAKWHTTVTELLTCMQRNHCQLIFVAEETGWGVVPAYKLGRTFRDRLGGLIRRVGAVANPVYLVTGGHVLNLSQLGTVLPDGH